MREQQAQILEVLSGPVELFIEAWAKPAQHNEHCLGYRYNQYLSDSKLRLAAVREAAREIIARARRSEEFQQAAE